MKFNLTLMMFAIVFGHLGKAQDTFQKVYMSKNDGCSSIQPTTDGGYILSGTKMMSGSRYDMYLLKINANGNIIWTKTYGGEGFTWGKFAQQTSDGGYIACGYNQSGMVGAYKICIVKADSSGNLLWSKKFGGHQFSSHEAYQVKQTSEGGFIICGYSAPEINWYRSAFLIKTNSIGDTLWTKAYRGNRDSYGYCVEQTTDGGYILAGQVSDSLNTTINDILLVKTNSEGDTLWTKTFGGANGDVAYAIKQTADGGYAVAGKTGSFGSGTDDVFLCKTDIGGNPIWTKAYGGTNYDRGKSLGIAEDGGYIVAGHSYSFGNNNGNYYLIKTTGNGDLQWAKSYGSLGFEAASCVIPSSDGGYIVSGSTNGFGNYGIYLVKTDANGYSGCNEINSNTSVISQNFQLSNLQISLYSGCSISIPTLDTGSFSSDSTLCFVVGTVENNTVSNGLLISPNPFSSVTTIKTDGNCENSTLTLYDLFGRQVKQIKNITGQTITLNRNDLSRGLYIITLAQDNKTYAIDRVIIFDH